MGTVHDVAARIIRDQRAVGRPIDKMQLQKLLYLVQGAHVALHGNLAFRADFRAYRRGPVIPAVEQTYRAVGGDQQDIHAPAGGTPDRVSPEQAEAIEEVLRLFGRLNGPSLENITKIAGAPWHQVRGDLARDADSNIEIPATLIARWFVTHPLRPSGQRPGSDVVETFDDVEDLIAALG